MALNDCQKCGFPCGSYTTHICGPLTVTYPARPLLVDLFCCEGGASSGYYNAGWSVLGVDRDPQPRYPFPFVQMDALDWLRRYLACPDLPIAAFHASPPCQFATVYGNNRAHVRDDHPNLIPATRELLMATGLPYVIENVEGARHHLTDAGPRMRNRP